MGDQSDRNIDLALQVDIKPAVDALKTFLAVSAEVGGQLNKLFSGEMLKPNVSGIDQAMTQLEATLSKYVSSGEATAAATEGVAAEFETATVPIEEFTNSLGENIPAGATVATETISGLTKQLQVLREQLSNAPVGSQQFKDLALQASIVQEKLNQAQATVQGVGNKSAYARMMVQQVNYAVSDSQMAAVNFRMWMMSVGNNFDMIAQYYIMLKQQAKDMNTTVGALLKGSLTSLNGWLMGITMFITLATVIPTFLKRTKEATKEANDELDRFAANIKQISQAGVLTVAQDLDKQIAKIRADRKAYEDEWRKARLAGNGDEWEYSHRKSGSDMAAIEAQLVKERDAAEKEYQDRLNGRYGIVQQLQAKIEDYNRQLNVAGLTEEKIRSIMDQKAKSQKELNDLMMTTNEWMDKWIAKTELGYKLGYFDFQTLIDRLTEQKRMTDDIEKQLQIEEHIKELKIAQGDLELKRQEAVKSFGTQQAKAEEDLWTSVQQMQIDVIEDEFKRRKANEEWRHTQAVADIMAEAATVGAIDMNGNLTGDAAKKMQLENEKNRQNNHKTDLDYEYELQRTKAEGIADQVKRENALYQAEREHTLQSGADKELIDAKLNQLELDHQTKLADIERSNFDDAISSAEQLGQILADAFSGGNSGAQKMVAFLRIALQMMQSINMLSNLKPGESGTSGVLGLIGSVVGLMGIADEGAIATGPGLVGVGAGVQEAFIPLDRLPSLLPGINAGANSSGINVGGIIDRLERIEKAFRSMPPPMVYIEGTTDINKYRVFKQNFDRIEKGREG